MRKKHLQFSRKKYFSFLFLFFDFNMSEWDECFWFLFNVTAKQHYILSEIRSLVNGSNKSKWIITMSKINYSTIISLLNTFPRTSNWLTWQIGYSKFSYANLKGVLNVKCVCKIWLCRYKNYILNWLMFLMFLL